MKARNLTALAVVATGAIAFVAPAAFAQAPDVSGVNGGLDKLGAIGKSAKKQARDARKKSKFETRTDNDIKRLGNNVSELRKKDDEITSTISNIVGTVTPILTQLGAVATSYADFQYGVVQLYYSSTGSQQLYAASVPFMETSRIDPTSQGSTVTGQFVVPFGAGGDLSAKVAVRSIVDPQAADNESTAFCRIAATNGTDTRTSIPNSNAANLPFYPIQRSPLKPTNKSEELTSLAGLTTDDAKTAVDLLDPTKAWAKAVGGTGPSGGAPVTTRISVGGGTGGQTVTVTLTCLKIGNTLLKETDVVGGGVLSFTLSCLVIPKS